MLKGNDLIVQVDGVAIASAKSCDIDTSCDVIEVSSPTSGTAREFIPGRSEWSVSCSFLLTGFKARLKAGTVVTLTIGSVTSGTRTLSSDKVSGSAIVRQAKVNGTRGKLCQGSWVFQGSGALS